MVCIALLASGCRTVESRARRQMESMMIPEVEFNNAQVSHVIEFIVEQMIPFDPVRIKPQYRRGPSVIRDPTAKLPKDPERERRYAKLYQYCGQKTVSLHLADTNFIALMDLVTRSANLEYKLKGDQIMILSPDGEVLVDAWSGEQSVAH